MLYLSKSTGRIKHEIEKTDWLIDRLNDEFFSEAELTQMKLGQLRYNQYTFTLEVQQHARRHRAIRD